MTPAEARSTLALLGTDRLQDVADRIGVSLSTIRIHLQRVYEKTATHRLGLSGRLSPRTPPAGLDALP